MDLRGYPRGLPVAAQQGGFCHIFRSRGFFVDLRGLSRIRSYLYSDHLSLGHRRAGNFSFPPSRRASRHLGQPHALQYQCPSCSYACRQGSLTRRPSVSIPRQTARRWLRTCSGTPPPPPPRVPTPRVKPPRDAPEAMTRTNSPACCQRFFPARSGSICMAGGISIFHIGCGDRAVGVDLDTQTRTVRHQHVRRGLRFVLFGQHNPHG